MKKKLYVGIDLHSNNNFLVIIDEKDKKLKQKKLPNEASEILRFLKPDKKRIAGVVVESTFNWYWLVDCLMEEGYQVHLANPAANVQYSGLKHTDDKYDAFWLAHLLRLGVLGTGYIYPKEDRAVRDLLRKRGQLVRQHTMNLLSMQSFYYRVIGEKNSSAYIQRLEPEDIDCQFQNPDLALTLKSNLAVIVTLKKQIVELEKTVLERCKLRPEFEMLLTIDGVGKILALTIMLETGDISRFSDVGKFVSYSRCISSGRFSNDKKKGRGNTKNGNKYLAWAFIEAANFIIRYNEQAKLFYHKKLQKTKTVIARKTMAHKVARAAYYVMKNREPFDSAKLFGC